MSSSTFSSSPASFVGYNRVLLTITAIALGAIAAYNIVIDPFALHPSTRTTLFDGHRSDARPRIHNSAVAASGDYDIALIGSSRLQRAISVDHPRFASRRAVNLANPATEIGEIAKICRFVRSRAPRAIQVVALDFHVFNASRRRPAVFDLTYFAPGTNPIDFWIDKWISQNTLRRSTKIVSRWLRDRVPNDHVLTKPEVILRSFHHGTELFREFEIGPEQWQALDEIFVQSREHPERLIIVFLPVHATLLEVAHRRDLWDDIENWKTRVVRAAPPEVEVWDFLIYSPIATLPLEHAETGRWFRDPSHASVELGGQVLDLILTSDRQTSDLGRRLTPANLHEHFEMIRHQRTQYLERQAEVPKWLDQVLTPPER